MEELRKEGKPVYGEELSKEGTPVIDYANIIVTNGVENSDNMSGLPPYMVGFLNQMQNVVGDNVIEESLFNSKKLTSDNFIVREFRRISDLFKFVVMKKRLVKELIEKVDKIHGIYDKDFVVVAYSAGLSVWLDVLNQRPDYRVIKIISIDGVVFGGVKNIKNPHLKEIHLLNGKGFLPRRITDTRFNKVESFNNLTINQKTLDITHLLFDVPKEIKLLLNKIKEILNIPQDDKSSIVSEDTYGGIDFNPGNLNIQSEGKKVEVFLPNNLQEYQDIEINGLVPFILNVTPISSLPLLSSKLASEEEKLRID